MLSTMACPQAYFTTGKIISIPCLLNETQKVYRQACNMSMSGLPDDAKRFMGFSTYDEAHHSWDAFRQNATLPATLPALNPRHIAVAESLRQKMLARYADQEAAVLRLPPPNTPLAGPSLRSTPTPVAHAPLLSPARPRLSAIAPLAASQSSAVLGSSNSESTSDGFWVVLGGPTPGVFNNRYACVLLIIYLYNELLLF